MDRRQFLRLTGLGVGTLVVPVIGAPRDLFGATTPIPTADKKALADVGARTRARAQGRHLRRRAHRPLPQPVRHHPRGQGAEHRQHRVLRRRRAGDRRRHLGLRRHQRRHQGRRRAAPPSRRWRSPRPTPSCRPSRCSWRRSKGYGEVELEDADREERLRRADRGEGRPAAGGQRRGAEGRRQLRQLAPLPGQRAEVLRLHRRLLHRPGRAPHLAQLHGHGDRHGHRQVPDPRRAVGADGHGLGVPDAARRRARSPAPTAPLLPQRATTCSRTPPLAAKQAQGEARPPSRSSPASTTWCSTPSTCG